MDRGNANDFCSSVLHFNTIDVNHLICTRVHSFAGGTFSLRANRPHPPGVGDGVSGRLLLWGSGFGDWACCGE